jgi:porin
MQRLRSVVWRRQRNRVGARCSCRGEVLAAVLVAIFICVSMTKRAAAQPARLSVEDPSVANARSPQVLERVSATDHHTVARLIGTRRDQACGIRTEPVYYGEVFTNARGGISTNNATRYEALLDLPISFNFEQMRLPLLGKFFLLAQNTHGRGLTENFVGDTLVRSNIDSFDNIMRVSEYWWEFGLLDDDVTVRLGKQDVNTEFLFMDSAADFIQSTFGLSPSTAFPTYPNPSMGAVVLVQLSESLRLKAGLWDALAYGGSWGFSGNDTVLAIGELEYTYTLFEGTLPGTLALGAVYESDGELLGEPLSAVQEYVVQLEQIIHRECPLDEDDAQGLALFAAYYPRFPGARVPAESIGDSAVAGIVYTGLIPQRDKDVLGAGVSCAELFQGGTNRETVFEFFYKAQVTPHTSLQPDIQYIATPSGIERNALVVGLRFQVTL